MTLDDFICMASRDEVKTDLELICTECGEHVCDVEHGDGLGVLVSCANGHMDTCPGDLNDWEDDGLRTRSDGRQEVDDTNEADDAYGCQRDTSCILRDGHEGDCCDDRERAPSSWYER